MLRFLFIMVLCTITTPAVAASPLTQAEQTVCRNLSHCLAIVDEHPQENFDYTVLAKEFSRFGARGHAALIRRVGRANETAGHAADLLAVMSDPATLPALSQLIEQTSGEAQSLVRRTLEAVASPKSTQPRPAPIRINLNTAQPICDLGVTVPLSAQKRELPFYEVKIARPDEYGRYRPSLKLRIERSQTDRTDLNSAVSRIGGWLAGYESGLIYYDAATGTPTVVMDRAIHSLQRFDQNNIASPVWALSQSDETLSIIDANPPTPHVKATLPGHLAELRRTGDGSLYVSSHAGVTLQMHADGRITPGCLSGEAS